MVVLSLCPSTKKMTAITYKPQLKRTYGSRGGTVFVTGYSKACKTKAGKPVKMSRIIRKEKKFKLQKCPSGLIRNPLTRRCDSEAYKKRFIQSLLKKRITQIRKYGMSQSSAMIPKKRTSSAKKTASGKKKASSKRVSYY